MYSLFLTGVSGCADPQLQEATTPYCTDDWFAFVESELVTGDEQGHGPDLGSNEWRSVVEFKLGIRGNSDIPDRGSDEWCQYIKKRL